MFGVPPSNLYGTSFHFAHPRWTSRIISPPPSNGSVASSRSCFPYRMPIPVGPSILCPLNARKSASRLWTSIGMCGAAWAASTTQIAPTSWARFAISLTGLMVPSTLEHKVTVTIFVLFHFQRPVVVDVDVLQDGALVVFDEVPRDVVGVVLHHGPDDLVPFLDLALEAVAVCDDVDRFRRGLREGDLHRRFRLDEGGDLLARALVLSRGLFPELVDCPVDVCVVPRIEIRRGVDHLLRFLGSGRTVEIDESLVPDGPLEDREVRLDGGHVQ